MIGAVLLTLTLCFQAAARLLPGFAEWYTLHVYSHIVGGYGRICGIFPVSVVELGLYVVMIAGVWYTAVHFHRWKQVLATVFCFVSVLLFLFTVNCGINY